MSAPPSTPPPLPPTLPPASTPSPFTPEERAARSSAVAGHYSAANILGASTDLSPSSLASAADSVRASPCFRSSILWGVGLGALFGLHRAKQGGSLLRCLNDGLLAGGGCVGMQWWVCRRDEVDKRAALRAFYFAQKRAQDGLAPAGPGGYTDEEWAAEVAATTSYAGTRPQVVEGGSTGVQLR